MPGLTRSPGKLILSGEHAVVQGAPALAMAVTLTASLQATPQEAPALTLQLPDRAPRSFGLDTLPDLLENQRQVHRAHPAESPEPEVLLAACAALVEPREGMHLHFSSDIPLGSGLGSSAAFILALLKNLAPGLSDAALYALALEGENFQHGRSSGLDVATSLRGGLIHFCAGEATPLPLTSLPAFCLYDSGKAQSSTGACVEKSRAVFRARPGLIADFSAVTTRIQQALTRGNLSAWQAGVQQNHALLCQLDVVPDPVKKVICGLEADGSPAKVCGAGSVRGPGAGMVLVCGPGPHPVPNHWRSLPLKLSSQGTCILSE